MSHSYFIGLGFGWLLGLIIIVLIFNSKWYRDRQVKKFRKLIRRKPVDTSLWREIR